MILDADCLLEAKVENVERLAVALGLRLPPYKGSHIAYSRKLVRLVLKQLEHERYAAYRNRTRSHGWGDEYDA
jgi:hypothetical protein